MGLRVAILLRAAARRAGERGATINSGAG